MSGLGLLLFLSWSVCGSLLAETATSASNENNTSSGNLTTTSPLTTEQSTPPSSTSKPIQTTTTTTTTSPLLNLNECRKETIVCGMLIVACTFFLMTTVLLTCTVCRLSQRIRVLSRSAQPNGNSDFMEAKKDKSKSEGKDKETTVLMSYVTQANQEPDSAATEQDGGKAEEDGGKVEEDGGKVEEDGGKVEEDGGKAEEDGQKSEEKNVSGSPTSEEALAAAENSTCSQPQE